MTDKEKLTELLRSAINGTDRSWNTVIPDCLVEAVAENLLANGVKLQESNGCEYCKADNEGFRRVFGAFSITNPFHGNVWNIETRHCKPRQIYFCPMCGRKLPEPPKGE